MARRPTVPELLRRGPFTVADAREAGLERWHLQGASWRRLHRGTYIWSDVPETTTARLEAAWRRLPPSAAFSGMTAAWLHGIDVPACDPVEVTIPTDLGISVRAGMRVRRAALPLHDVVRIHGIRATGAVRTVAELCGRLELVEAVVIADAFLHARKARVSQLMAWADANAGRPGMKRLRKVLGFAERASESPMESRLRMVLLLGGLPRPRAQVAIHSHDGRFIGRPDLYYDEARLGIEYDGGIHRNQLAEDNRRQNNLLREGVRLLRFTSADVLQNPASIVLQVRALLGS